MSTARLNALNIRYNILERERDDLRGSVDRLTAENVQLRAAVADLARCVVELDETNDEGTN